MALNGSNQYLIVPNNAVLNPIRQITITGWFKANNLAKVGTYNVQTIFFKGNTPDYISPSYTTDNRQYNMWLSNNGLLGFASTSENNIGGGQTYCPGIVGAVSAGKWYHVAGVINSDAGTIEIYLNGKMQNSCPYSTLGIRTTTGNL